MRRLGYLLTLVMAIALAATAGFAQDGKLKIKVTPKQAYVFVDGQAIREGNHSISLPAGKHTVVVVNYGYKSSTQDVNIDAGKSTPLEVKLEAIGGNVAGPFGDIELKGDERAAVLSNGTTPDYFVGHVDEFNCDWIWHQNLLLPAWNASPDRHAPGQNDLVGRRDVVANKKVTVHLIRTARKRPVDWKRGEKLKDVPRFKAGIASAAGGRGARYRQLQRRQCQHQLRADRNSELADGETVDANISGIGTVQPSGSQTVSPHATTNYDFSATAPAERSRALERST